MLLYKFTTTTTALDCRPDYNKEIFLVALFMFAQVATRVFARINVGKLDQALFCGVIIYLYNKDWISGQGHVFPCKKSNLLYVRLANENSGQKLELIL